MNKETEFKNLEKDKEQLAIEHKNLQRRFDLEKAKSDTSSERNNSLSLQVEKLQDTLNKANKGLKIKDLENEKLTKKVKEYEDILN